MPTGCIPGFNPGLNQMTPNAATPGSQGVLSCDSSGEPSTPLTADAAGAAGVPKRRRACMECHKAKAACEGDPCHRCVRLGKVCVSQERPIRRRRTEGSERGAAIAAGFAGTFLGA